MCKWIWVLIVITLTGVLFPPPTRTVLCLCIPAYLSLVSPSKERCYAPTFRMESGQYKGAPQSSLEVIGSGWSACSDLRQ